MPDLTRADGEFEIEDDGSDPDQFADHFARVASRCDLLLGPYPTHLMREAGKAMAEIDGVLWNQGGSGDDVQALCAGRIVSVLVPTSRYSTLERQTTPKHNSVGLMYVPEPAQRAVRDKPRRIGD